MGKITLCYDNILTVIMAPEQLLVVTFSTIYILLKKAYKSLFFIIIYWMYSVTK